MTRTDSADQHTSLGVTSIYSQGIDSAEIIERRPRASQRR
jgi:hypothetical protein